MGTITQSTIISRVAEMISDTMKWKKRKKVWSLFDTYLQTRTPPRIDATNVIGRDKDLKKLWKVLSEKNHVLLSGFGGIGKTMLAQMFFYKYNDKFDEVAWIDYQGDLAKSFLCSIHNWPFEKYFKNEEELLDNIVRTLIDDKKKKLFIIDNVDCMDAYQPQHDSLLQELTEWKDTTVLLISRMERLENYHTFNLNCLSEKNCHALFRHYYKGSDVNPEAVANLVELAGRHTLTVELLAKGARQEEDLGKYYQKVKRGFDEADEKFRTLHHHNEEETIVNYLRCLYKMKNLNPNEVQVLQALAVLPVNSELFEKELEDWFGLKKSDWTALVQDGLLQMTSSFYSLHPLVRTIVREDWQKGKNICPGDVAGKFLVFLATDYRRSRGSSIYEERASCRRMTGIVKSVIDAVTPEESERFGTIFLGLSRDCSFIGDYNKAMEYGLRSLVIRKKVLGEDHPDTARSYINIGYVHDDIGDNEKALEIEKIVLGEDNPSLSAFYNIIGCKNLVIGNYYKALWYLEEALEIRKKDLGEEHPDTARSYYNLGLADLFTSTIESSRAQEYFEKALKISEATLGENHPDTQQIKRMLGGTKSAMDSEK